MTAVMEWRAPDGRRPLQLAGVVIAAALLLASAAHAGPAEGTSPPGATVDELLVLAHQLSPALAARALESDAAAARVDTAGALDDPLLTITSDEDRDDHGTRKNKMIYGVEQEIPLWGKRDLRRGIAVAEADGAQARQRQALLDLDAEIKIAFAAYYRASTALRIQDDVHALLHTIAESARGRYAQGLGTQADAIRAEIEKSRLLLERQRLERDRRVAAARLNTLLARPAGAALADPAELRPLPKAGELTLDYLLAQARQNNPQVATAAAEIAAAEGDRRLVERSWYPDLTLGAAAIQRQDGADGFIVSAGIRVPLQWGLRRAQAREATAKLGAARTRRDGELLELEGSLEAALADLDAARQSGAVLTNELTPQVTAAYQSALTAYQLGRGDLTAVLEAAHHVQEVQLAGLASEEQTETAIATIERIIGGEL